MEKIIQKVWEKRKWIPILSVRCTFLLYFGNFRRKMTENFKRPLLLRQLSPISEKSAEICQKI